MSRHAGRTEVGPVEMAARFVAEQPGGAGRIFERHEARGDGTCTGCGVYRPVQWPCLMIFIARRAEEITDESLVRPARSAAGSGGKPEPQPAVLARQRRKQGRCDDGADRAVA